MTAQPRERAVLCIVCRKPTWNNSAVCTADTVPARPVTVKAACVVADRYEHRERR